MREYKLSEIVYWCLAIAFFILSGVALMESVLTEMSVIYGFFLYIILNTLGVFIVKMCLEKYYIKVEEL